MKPSTPQGSSDFYASVAHGNQHTSQGANVSTISIYVVQYEADNFQCVSYKH